MSDSLDLVDWIAFHRGNPSRQEVVKALTRPNAIEKGAKAMRVGTDKIDASVVCEGESVAAAKVRVAAGGVGA